MHQIMMTIEIKNLKVNMCFQVLIVDEKNL